MSYPVLLEAATAKLLAVLQSDLPAELDAIDTAAADGIVLADVADWIEGERAPKDYPALWVLGRAAEKDLDEAFAQLAGQFPYGGGWIHTVEIVVAAVEPDDAGTLMKRLYRYAAAIAKVIKRHEAPGVPGSTVTSEWSRARLLGYNLRDSFEHVRETQTRQDVHVYVQVHRDD